MTLAIAKFGGTSMANSAIIERSAKILTERPEIRLCVISATAGTTNQLFAMARLAAAGPETECSELFKTFHHRHVQIGKELGMKASDIESFTSRVQEILKGMQLLKETSLSALDDLVSHGELISSVLFAQALKNLGLKVRWIDARKIMRTSSDHGRALPHLELLKANCDDQIRPLLNEMIVVTQGYIGSGLDGRTTTLGKEGSDYSTALFAEALRANEVQIWKDVAGIMTTDPRIVAKARTISEISFAEAGELTRFGAKVIHPDTFLPIKRAHIPLYVGYSQDSSVKGTKIIPHTPTDRPSVRAISMKKDQKWLTVKETEGHNSPFFLSEVLQRLNQHRVIPTLIATSENRLGFVIDKIFEVNADLMLDLERLGETELKDDTELLAIIGPQVKDAADIMARSLGSLEGAKPLLVSTGASEHSVCMLFPAGLAEGVLKRLHHIFLE